MGAAFSWNSDNYPRLNNRGNSVKRLGEELFHDLDLYKELILLYQNMYATSILR